MSGVIAIANLGAEESEGRSAATEEALAPLVQLFCDSVERDPPSFEWLPRRDACVAWLNTPEAEAIARAHRRSLFGAPPSIVRSCHDKAFALRAARAAGLEPAPLQGQVDVFEPQDLYDSERVCEQIRARFEQLSHPAGLTLKPRIGTSGRGRVPLKRLDDLARVPLALARLQRAGGAVLEPWLERSADLSVSLYIAPDGSISTLGSAELIVTPAGVYRGHRGKIDAQGRVVSGLPQDAAMRSAALEIARAAAAQGYTGPCGIDGFVFRSGGCDWLRPIVELNARFTIGIVMIACLREHLPEIVRRLELRSDDTAAFDFELAPISEAASPACGTWVLPLGRGLSENRPLHCVASSSEARLRVAREPAPLGLAS